MKVLILKPRLDTTFKKGPVPRSVNPNIPEIRVHWRTFLDNLQKYHESRGDEVLSLERPLWQFSEESVLSRNPDIAYIPHKDKYRFKCDNIVCLYYMQMVFPWIFEVDCDGPFSYSSNFPQPIYEEEDLALINSLKERADKGISKFNQPKTTISDKNYILFAGQIERDESIQLHSEISVKEAAQKTLSHCKANNIPLVIKPHPFDSSGVLEKLSAEYGSINKSNIISLIKNSASVITVNSGCGMEALLFDKPVLHFGKAEYAPVAIDVSKGFPGTLPNKIPLYGKFLTSYFRDRINSTDINSYKYLEKFFE